jgi:hypothetical protein
MFGSAAGFGASLDLAALDGSNGFRLEGIDEADFSSFSVAGAGDINGDGLDDLIIGAPYADPDGRPTAGESYVVFGSGAGFAPNVDLSTLNGVNGVALDGVGTTSFDRSGFSVASAGDNNGDGIDDLIIGAPGASPEGAGESYVVFGFSSDPGPILGGPDRDVMTGTAADEVFYPGGGYDFVTTGGGSDTIHFNGVAGSRDVLTIADFDPLADTLDLQGATVAETFESPEQTMLLLEGADRDTIVLLGLPESPFDLLV